MDYDLWLRMLIYAENIIFIDTALSIQRTHAEQKTANRDDRFERERVFAAMRVAKLLGEPPMIWVAKSWARRYLSAYRQRKLGMLKGSLFHRTALKALFSL
jgi:hypothetical protein